MGSFNPDQPIPLAVLTNWNGQSFFATIGGTDRASQIVFSDLDNSLGFGGNTFELLDTNIFLAHLDDAASFTVDDDDDDVLVQIRVASKRTTPESSSVLVYITLGGLILGSAIRKARK